MTMTFTNPGEQALDTWMAQHAKVIWVSVERPWDLEAQLFRRLSLPLNIQDNRGHAFCATLQALRRGRRRDRQGAGHRREGWPQRSPLRPCTASPRPPRARCRPAPPEALLDPMKPIPFDATVDLLAHHLERAGIPEDRSQEALPAVREALRTLPGARWVDVDYLDRMDPQLLGPQGDRWLTLYRPGRGATQVEGPRWQPVRLAVEAGR